MRVHFDVSVFLRQGYSYGKFSIDAVMDHAPAVGDFVNVAALSPRKLGDAELAFLNCHIPNLQICSLNAISTDDSMESSIAELEDIVLSSPQVAGQVFEILSRVDFDCDTW